MHVDREDLDELDGMTEAERRALLARVLRTCVYLTADLHALRAQLDDARAELAKLRERIAWESGLE